MITASGQLNYFS